MEYVCDVSLWGGLLLEHGYELLGRLDSGSFSEVFAVRNTTTQRLLAVKRMVARREITLDPRIKIEISCLSQLSIRGSCVIGLEGTIWRADRLACLVLELAPLGDLERYATDHWPLSPKLVMAATRQMLSALNHCHRLHIAHRDVNPANVLLMSERSVRLADFGLAFHCRKPTGHRVLCEDYLGREAYLAPEVLRHMPYDAVQADMWSMSSLCIFMLTGKHPLPSRPSSMSEDDSSGRSSMGKDSTPVRTSNVCTPSCKGFLSPTHNDRLCRISSSDSEGSCRSESDIEEYPPLFPILDIQSDCASSPRSSAGGDSYQREGEADSVHWTSNSGEGEVFKQLSAVDYAVVHLVSKLRVDSPPERLVAEDALQLWKQAL